MDDQRIGRTVRALRRRRAWRQIDLAGTAGCSQNLMSLVERGHLDRVALRTVRRLLSALDATVTLDVRWRGAGLERLLDDGHATLSGAVADLLRRLGWLVEIEVTYSEYGERGSIDVLAFHPGLGILLVIEIKTDLPSAEATLRKLDEKTRLATQIAARRFRWRARSVARLLVMPEVRTLRRRVARHAALFDQSLPARNVAVRQWLRTPSGTIAGIWFVTDRDTRVPIRNARATERVRKPKSVTINSESAG